MHFICREKQFTQFFLVAKRINALCPENIGALNFAIQKVQTFGASGQGCSMGRGTSWGSSGASMRSDGVKGYARVVPEGQGEV